MMTEWEHDSTSGYYQNQRNGFYYDPNSGFYYSDAIGMDSYSGIFAWCYVLPISVKDVKVVFT